MKKFRDFIKPPKKEQLLFLGFIRKGMSPVPKDKREPPKEVKEQYWPLHHPEHMAVPDFDHASDHLTEYLRAKGPTVPKIQEAIHNYTHDSSPLNHMLLHNKDPKLVEKSSKLTKIRGDLLFDGEREMDQHLSRAIKLNTSQKDMHLYTGISFSPEHHDFKKPFLLPAYTSTSLKKSTAAAFAFPPENTEHIYKNRQKITSNNNDHHADALKGLDDKYYGGKIKTHEYHDAKGELEKRYGPPTHGGNEKDVYNHMIRVHVPAGSHAVYAHPLSNHVREHEVIIHKGAQVRLHPEPELDHDHHMVIWHAKLTHDGVKATRHAKEKDENRPKSVRPDPQFSFMKDKK